MESKAENPREFAPLVEECERNGISRTKAYELAKSGMLDTFRIGNRRLVRLESLRTLPERLAGAE